MTLEEAMAQLEAAGQASVRRSAYRMAAGTAQFGVRMGDIRKIAKAARRDHGLGLHLWQTGNADARLMAVLLLKPAALSADEVEEMVRGNALVSVSDWLTPYIVRLHPEKEALRLRWMVSDHPMLARAGWSLTAERVEKTPEGLDLPALLDRLEAEMPAALPEVQWTMNTTLAAIGIHHPAQRARAIAMGEAMGIYRDYPTPKGCTSPFAPLWIAEMVRRAG